MNILKKLAMKHFNLQEIKHERSREAILQGMFGDLHCTSSEGEYITPALNTVVSQLNRSIVNPVSIEMYQQTAAVRAVSLSSRAKASTKEVTVIIKYRTKFDDTK